MSEYDELLARMVAITGEEPQIITKQRAAIEKGAKILGIDPVDYAALISYESAGTFDPWAKGITTKWGEHRGTLQYNELYRKKFHVYEGQSFEDQVTYSNVRYLISKGVKPGAKFPEICAAINPKVSADVIREAEIEHRAKVLQRFWGSPTKSDQDIDNLDALIKRFELEKWYQDVNC